jgi:serine/threonine protein kinase/tetratricopeptide (TPR) repeat protein
MREREIFDAALAIANPAERSAYLAEVCSGNHELREHIEGLLDMDRQLGDFLELSAHSPVATVDEPQTERPGTVIGSYKLLEQIGEGGFGIVFMAEQQQPVRRKVALKVLKPGMDTRQVVARFEAERQALALMDHPHIAQVFDGGETASGRPYFVMELVRGIPITDFCDHNHLSVRERLGLFVSVCQAVQHAHQKGVIHRDLKPSNVLVTLHDGTPVVKVIDFGIAKALGQQLTDKTLFTNFAQLIGTPLYMSPEQAQMSGLDVDTRTDGYALGMLLYELLTGTTPFDQERLRTAGFDEMRRIIREEEPPRPSTRISTLGQAAATVSDNRKSNSRQLSRLCRGELDWVVMKALEKDRNRRYETASAFAADVQRYLHDEPVQACPPSVGYRLRKFARRNRTGLAIAGPILVCIVFLAGVAGWTFSDRAVRRAKLNYGVEVALEEAQAGREQALTQTENPYQWQATLAAAFSVLKRAEELAAQDPAALNAAVAARLQALRATLDADERDRRFVEQLDKVLQDVLVWRDHRSKTRRHEALPKLKSAFLDYYGIHVGMMPAAEAASLIRQRPVPVQVHLLAALDVGVARTPDGDAPTTKWLQTVLDQAESDPVRKRARQALRAGDWPALAQLAKEAGPQPPVLLHGFLSQLPDFAAREKSDLIDKMRQAYPGEFRAPNRFARALNYDILAWLLATTDDPDWRLERRALELSKEAVKLAPNDGDFWNTLGMAYYRVGNWKEALAALETAMALSGGGDGLDWLILAMVQWHLGNKEEARRRYDQAIPWLEENGTDRTFRRLQAEAAELLGVKEKND